MAPILIGVLGSALEKVLDTVFPDPVEGARVKMEAAKMQQDGRLAEIADETSRLIAQIEVNKAEASSGNVWASGWRPAFGWMCAAVVFSQFIMAPYLPWLMEVFGFYAPPIPKIDLEMLWPLIMGMMGLSWNRSQDKAKGVA
jgi:hypothetical protein